MLPHKLIEKRLRQAVSALLPDADLSTVRVRPCPDPKFGDYQSSALMSLAKARKRDPRELAGEVVGRLDLNDCCEKVEIAGAGFLNFRLKPETLAKSLQAVVSGGPLFFEKTDRPRTVVVDFSSPNVAKPMHVGHIRSTILGDTLARVLRLLGERVITDNHLGDWGTQFGKLLVGWKHHLNAEALKDDPIAEMERLYKLVNTASETDPAMLDAARKELVKLQAGDEQNLAIWREMTALSQSQFETIYRLLGVKFDHTFGESSYNARLPSLVAELFDRGIARPSEGALAVFFEEIPQLKDHPALIQKSDGGFNYTTTDLATLEHRLKTWQPDEVVYVTDGRQQLHFQQLFMIFRRWHTETEVKLAHVWFGSILGEDGKPFRTRAGETIRLSDLLDEAQERALKVVSEKSPDLPEAQRREIARIVGIGAIKYADLLPNRQSDYVFSWDKMLALHGNTAPYLQYAYARIRSIFRRAEELKGQESKADPQIRLESEHEASLGKHLLNFGIVLETVAEEYRPNFLCNYLYELAGYFTAFYENCPVLKSEPAQRASRLLLCDLTGRVFKEGLAVLGIETLEQM